MDSNAAISPAYVPPVPVQPKSRKKMWVIIILSVLLAIFLLIAGCCALVYKVAKGAVKQSDVYIKTIQRAQASPCAASKLGQPLQFKSLPQGSVNENNGSGSADLTLPVEGPQGSGSLHTLASRDNNVWTLTSVTLTVGDAQYDLPADPAPCEP